MVRIGSSASSTATSSATTAGSARIPISAADRRTTNTTSATPAAVQANFSTGSGSTVSGTKTTAANGG